MDWPPSVLWFGLGEPASSSPTTKVRRSRSLVHLEHVYKANFAASDANFESPDAPTSITLQGDGESRTKSALTPTLSGLNQVVTTVANAHQTRLGNCNDSLQQHHWVCRSKNNISMKVTEMTDSRIFQSRSIDMSDSVADAGPLAKKQPSVEERARKDVNRRSAIVREYFRMRWQSQLSQDVERDEHAGFACLGSSVTTVGACRFK